MQEKPQKTKEVLHPVKACDVVKTDFKGLYLAI